MNINMDGIGTAQNVLVSSEKTESQATFLQASDVKVEILD